MAAALSPRPSVPSPYVAGRIGVPAGTPVNLLGLIQAQLDPNCPGTAVELQIVADRANTVPVYVGAYSRLAGPLSASNWGSELLAGDGRVYASTYPGSSVPLGQLQVFAAAQAWLHVEVQT